jgi:hypothetical protein
MSNSWEIAHTASIIVAAPADVAFGFMSDGLKQSRWALGSWDRRVYRDDIFVGTSLFNNNELYVRLVSDPKLRLVDYFCGEEPDDLRHLVEARVIPGEVLGYGEGNCAVILTTWREANTSDQEWDITHHVWQTEIQLIKGNIEREYSRR